VIVSSSKSRKASMTQGLMKSLCRLLAIANRNKSKFFPFPCRKKFQDCTHWKKTNLEKNQSIVQRKNESYNPEKYFCSKNRKGKWFVYCQRITRRKTNYHYRKTFPNNRIRKEIAIQSIEQTDFITRLYRKIFPAQTIHIILAEIGITNFHIGRKEEMQILHDCGKKKINLLITRE